MSERKNPYDGYTWEALKPMIDDPAKYGIYKPSKAWNDLQSAFGNVNTQHLLAEADRIRNAERSAGYMTRIIQTGTMQPLYRGGGKSARRRKPKSVRRRKPKSVRRRGSKTLRRKKTRRMRHK